MNPDNESEGRELIQAWKNTSAEVIVDFLTASRDSSVQRRGRITALDDRRIVISSGEEEIEVDITGARFTRVATRSTFAAMGLDPGRYPETVEISLGNMDRLTLWSHLSH